MKFTFKTTKPTGRYRSFEDDLHDIKLNKIIVGYISDRIPYRIHFKIYKNDINSDNNFNCDWKWITLKHKSNSLKEAKEFLNDNINQILGKWNLVKE